MGVLERGLVAANFVFFNLNRRLIQAASSRKKWEVPVLLPQDRILLKGLAHGE
jgi:hypothetical protein